MATAKDSSAQYAKAVGAAADALIRGENANWELARLTYENTSTGAGDRSKVPMSKWCSDVREASGRRFSENSGQTYKRIWRLRLEKDPQVHEDLSFTEAYYEATNDSREKIMERHSKYVHTQSPEVKRETFEKLAVDPDVVDAPEVIARTLSDERVAGGVADAIERDPMLSARFERAKGEHEPRTNASRAKAEPLDVDNWRNWTAAEQEEFDAKTVKAARHLLVANFLRSQGYVASGEAEMLLQIVRPPSDLDSELQELLAEGEGRL